jgi:nucleotide-binding universal stress UspA family protein
MGSEAMTEPLERYGKFQRILFCTDFSTNAEFAFHFAIDIAERNTDSTLYIFHVVPEVEAQFWKTYIYEMDDVDEKAKHDLEHMVQEKYLAYIPETIRSEVEFRIGKDYMEILSFAKEKDIDLIIMGRQGQSSFQKMLFGNVTEKVTRHSECPVLVIPLIFQQKMK